MQAREPSRESILERVKSEPNDQKLTFTLREKCPYSELFWSIFSRIQTE